LNGNTALNNALFTLYQQFRADPENHLQYRRGNQMDYLYLFFAPKDQVALDYQSPISRIPGPAPCPGGPSYMDVPPFYPNLFLPQAFSVAEVLGLGKIGLSATAEWVAPRCYLEEAVSSDSNGHALYCPLATSAPTGGGAVRQNCCLCQGCDGY